MSKILCAKCQKNDAKIDQFYGPLWCDSCNAAKKPISNTMFEFTTDAIKEERGKYLKSIIQPFRQGELSAEYVRSYPQQVAGMVKEGTVTHDQVRRAKDVWKDQPNYHNLEKTI
jgi:hypothetical protein